jgi:anaerobic selenocysteine-containing dehydrogenase
MLVWAGNPILSTPNGTQLDVAFAGLELLVSVDYYITETSRHAHYILPPVGPLARPHYDAAFHVFGVRNTARWSDPLVPPEGDTRHDWQIAVQLGNRLDALRGGGFRKRLARKATSLLGPERMVDLALRMGPHKVSLRSLRAQPSGVDFGALRPCLANRLPPGHQIDLAPEPFLADVPRLTEALDAEVAPLMLIGRRELRSNNSWMHNQQRLIKGKPRCVAMIHPDDAAAAGVSHGDEVRLTGRVGDIALPAQVTDDVMPGVICVPHGYGHGRPGVALSVASTVAGVSVNDVTDDKQVDPISGNAVLNGVAIQLSTV